jgi:hypothetical protein
MCDQHLDDFDVLSAAQERHDTSASALSGRRQRSWTIASRP